LVSLLSAPIAAVSGVLFFVVSFLSIARIRHRESVPERAEPPTRTWWRILEGIRFVAGRRFEPADRTARPLRRAGGTRPHRRGESPVTNPESRVNRGETAAGEHLG
jgi:hypothetical protein